MYAAGYLYVGGWQAAAATWRLATAQANAKAGRNGQTRGSQRLLKSSNYFAMMERRLPKEPKRHSVSPSNASGNPTKPSGGAKKLPLPPSDAPCGKSSAPFIVVKHSGSPSSTPFIVVEHSWSPSSAPCTAARHSGSPSRTPSIAAKHSGSPSRTPFIAVKVSGSKSSAPFIAVKVSM